jgi:putative spermidine/putrescine transport system substrate-binding protein
MNKRIAVASSLTAALLAAGCGSGAAPSSSAPTTFTFSAGGGSNQTAFASACVTPFAKLHHLKAIENINTVGQSQLEVMEKDNDVTINVDLDGVQSVAGGNWSNLLDPINYNIVNRSVLPAKYYFKYGVAHDTYALVMVYNKKMYGKNPPKTLAEFFNTKKYPGLRAFPSVLVDGPAVSSEIVDAAATNTFPPTYPLSMTKIFSLLTSDQKDIDLYNSSAAAEELFDNHQVNLGIIYASHVPAIVQAGIPLAIQWNQNVNWFESLQIPKGAPDPTLDNEFINYCISKTAQVNYSEAHPEGPVNPAAFSAIPRSDDVLFPSYPPNAKVGFEVSNTYWTPAVDNAFTTAWEKWQAGG